MENDLNALVDNARDEEGDAHPHGYCSVGVEVNALTRKVKLIVDKMNEKKEKVAKT